MRSAKLRGEVKSTVRAAYSDTAVTQGFKSKVVHPRNPKLVRGNVEDDKVFLEPSHSIKVVGLSWWRNSLEVLNENYFCIIK